MPTQTRQPYTPGDIYVDMGLLGDGCPRHCVLVSVSTDDPDRTPLFTFMWPDGKMGVVHSATASIRMRPMGWS